MTLPDRTAPRKLRRLGLWGPYVLLLVLVAAWSAGWLWLRAEIVRQMDAAHATASAAGGGLSWASRTISGFPFRLDVNLTDLRLRQPSGWGLAVPTLKAEAQAFAPTHWVALAPNGAVLTRPSGGAVIVAAKVLRASLSQGADRPPRLSVEGVGLIFTPDRGAQPFFISAAQAFHLHTRAGPADQGAFYVEVDQAQAPLPGLMGRIAEGKPVNFVVDAIYSHAGALDGPDWATAVDAWRRAGGAINLRRLRLQAGVALLDGRAGTLTVGADGRLQGSMRVSLRQAPRALAVMGQAGAIAPEAAGAASAVVGAQSQGPGPGAVATVTLDFQAGQTTLGPAAIGPAPKVY